MNIVNEGQDIGCRFPGCHNEAICSSGNFGDRLVCDYHFHITNGTLPLDKKEALELALLAADLADCLQTFASLDSLSPDDWRRTLDVLKRAGREG